MKKAVFKNLSLFEVIVYALAAALALWGLTYITLGLIEAISILALMITLC